MPQTTCRNIAQSDHDACRIARLLMEKYGFLEALRRASDRFDRYRAESAGGDVCTHAERWVYWDLVTESILERAPAAYAMPRSDLMTIVRHRYAA